MTSAEKSFPELLRGVIAELDSATVSDTASLARPRAKVAWIASMLPTARYEARRLLDLAAEVASAIGIVEGEGDLDARRLGATRAAVGAAVEHLGDPDDFGKELLIIQAGQQLLRTIGRDPAEWMHGSNETATDADAGSEPQSLSLDDTAALLLMVEPHEREEMEKLRASLTRLAGDEGAVELVRNLAAEAAASITRVLDDIDAERDHSIDFATASDYVDQAMRARDDAETASMWHSSMETSAEATPAIEPVATATAPMPVVPDAVIDTLPEGDLELVADFVAECRDYLESAEAALLELEGNPTDSEAINTVFRAFHTVKGTSGFLGLDVITSFAHEAESLFTRVREKELPFAGGIPDIALRAVDVVKALISSVEQALGGKPMTRPGTYNEVLAELARIAAGDAAAAAAPVRLQYAEHEPEQSRSARTASGEAALVADAPVQVRQEKASWAGEERRDVSSDSSIRVRTDRLDRLIDMIAELVIAQTMIAQDSDLPSVGHNGLSRKVSHAGKIVRELHDLSLSMRMVPLKPTFGKMTRVVRDVAQMVGKEIEFVTDGEETEIDRNMVDALSDPLVHMVRNAVDHGIEMPDVRAAGGKPRQGTIRLSAMHAGGNVVVELRDDGRGLDKERIVAKAIEKGLIESASKMSDSEIFNLIFAPGFSTAAQVTGLSGRGVGMDVVRRNIDSLRGRIEIRSAPGEGTVFTVRLPLTLAVTDGMLVQVGVERYVIPTTSIFMSFRPERGALSTVAGRGEMVRLRDDVMPMFRLHRLFSVDGAQEDPCAALVVVVAVGEQRVAILVDALLGQQQVVAKTLGDGIGKIDGVSGGAILGDGRVGLILDIGELIVLLRRQEESVEPLRSVA